MRYFWTFQIKISKCLTLIIITNPGTKFKVQSIVKIFLFSSCVHKLTSEKCGTFVLSVVGSELNFNKRKPEQKTRLRNSIQNERNYFVRYLTTDTDTDTDLPFLLPTSLLTRYIVSKIKVL